MHATCPECGASLEVPFPGSYECERCRTRFDVAPEPAPSTRTAPAPEPAPQAPCAVHAENPAAAVCERCGDFMCELCATRVEGRLYCPRCFDLLFHRGAFSFSQRQFTLPGLAMGLGIGGFITSLACVCLLVAVPLGIGGILTGMKALKEHNQRPDLPHRGLTIAGLVFSSLALLVSAAQVVFWAVVISSRR